MKNVILLTVDTLRKDALGIDNLKDPQEKNNMSDSHPRTNELKEKLLPRINRWESS